MRVNRQPSLLNPIDGPGPFHVRDTVEHVRSELGRRLWVLRWQPVEVELNSQ